MELLAQHTGAWAGTNAFRLMPGDPTHDAGMRAQVAPAANGNLVTVAYAWTHPDDGEQEGLLIAGPGTQAGTVSAFWGDSWHQQPEPRALGGTVAGGVIVVAYDYAGDWRWAITVDARDPAVLILTMDNVIPASAATPAMSAGPYAAMHAVLRRA